RQIAIRSGGGALPAYPPDPNTRIRSRACARKCKGSPLSTRCAADRPACLLQPTLAALLVDRNVWSRAAPGKSYLPGYLHDKNPAIQDAASVRASSSTADVAEFPYSSIGGRPKNLRWQRQNTSP